MIFKLLRAAIELLLITGTFVSAYYLGFVASYRLLSLNLSFDIQLNSGSLIYGAFVLLILMVYGTFYKILRNN